MVSTRGRSGRRRGTARSARRDDLPPDYSSSAIPDSSIESSFRLLVSNRAPGGMAAGPARELHDSDVVGRNARAPSPLSNAPPLAAEKDLSESESEKTRTRRQSAAGKAAGAG